MDSSGATGLDRLSRTFSSDREFCDTLAKIQPRNTARLFVYLQWAHKYLTTIQEEMHSMVRRHFAPESARDAAFWTMALTAGIFRDLGLIPYLVVRGIIWDAGFAVRRSLENAGVLAHLWAEPSKARLLNDPETGDFKNAFIAEPNKTRAAELRSKGVQKRFAACSLAQSMSDLYRMLSAYSIHGGAPHHMVHAEVKPTRQSCMFVNRPDPTARDLAQDLALFAAASEILCVEICFVHGTFGNRYGLLPSKGGEGGFFLTKMLDKGPHSLLDELVTAAVRDLGWENPVS